MARFMFARLRHWSQWMLARLPSMLPNACALCGRDDAHALCAGCHAQYFHPPARRCCRCGLPLAAANDPALCGTCLKKPPAFDATIVTTDYSAPADQLVLALKFGNRPELAGLLAHLMRDTLLGMPEFPLPSCLTAVPLGQQRLRERGFNQALEIARPLSRSLGIMLAPRLLVRRRDTQAQSLLHPGQRRANTRNAFALRAAASRQVRGLHVGVVDDVMTTGETLNEVAATLKRHGALRVTNFVFARTPQK